MPRARLPLALVMLTTTLLTGCAGMFGKGREPAAAPTGVGPGVDVVRLYVGTSSGEILVFGVDPGIGTLTPRGQASFGRAATTLAADREGRVLYAAGDHSGEIGSFSIRPRTGGLASLGRASTRGGGASQLVVHRSGKYLLAANPGSSGVSVVSLKLDGALGGSELFPVGAAAQGIGAHPAGESVFVVGGADRIAQFGFNSGTGMLTASTGRTPALPGKTRPRRLVFDAGGRFAYVLSDGNSSVSGYAFEERTGTLSPISFQTISTLPDGVKPAKGRPADVVAVPWGRYLYVANAGQDNVAIFAADRESGMLTLVGHEPSRGKQPRALAFVEERGSSLLLVANQSSGGIAIFRPDRATGALQHLGSTPVRGGPASLLVMTGAPPAAPPPPPPPLRL
jgi:6-phosphogluconolactonase